MTSAPRIPVQSAEVIWQEHDKKHKGWTVHLQAGEEVIKYPPPQPGPGRDAADAELVSLAVHAAAEDGYDLDAAAVKITR
jgi:hypothetical protein